jgi:hypothetical protein
MTKRRCITAIFPLAHHLEYPSSRLWRLHALLQPTLPNIPLAAYYGVWKAKYNALPEYLPACLHARRDRHNEAFRRVAARRDLLLKRWYSLPSAGCRSGHWESGEAAAWAFGFGDRLHELPGKGVPCICCMTMLLTTTTTTTTTRYLQSSNHLTPCRA